MNGGRVAALNAQTSTSAKAKWTVMVFMGAATFGGSAPLFEAAEADLAEMRSVGSGAGLDIYVQVHGDGPPRRGKVTKTWPMTIGALDDVKEGERESAQGLALQSFIRTSLIAAGHNPLNPNHHSMLVLWGHAYDFAIGREKGRDGTINALDFTVLSDVLKRLQQEFRAPTTKLDILGFDACDIATAEIARQLQPFAKYLLGSQIGVPIPGWPYDLVLGRLRVTKGTMTPSDLGAYIVRRFCESYNAATDVVSLTLLDLNRAGELSVFARFLSLALANAVRDPETLDLIAYLFSQSQTAADKPYVDVADLCFNLARSSGEPLVIEAATALGDFLISPTPSVPGAGKTETVRPFVVEHGRNAGQTARLNGLSIYAPNVAPIRDVDAVRRLYEDFVFAQETEWSALVHDLAMTSS